MGYIQGEGRNQGTLFPVVLDDLVPLDHVCRVIDAFVDRLEMEQLGFARAEAAETGRPGYDPRDLLKLYLYGYLHQMRSSRRLEAECRRNVELMWLLGRLYPDHKSIAEFRRLHRDAVADVGAELVRFARSVGLVHGEWVAVDGSKFRAASSVYSVTERRSLERYLEQMDSADNEPTATIDSSAVAAALQQLQKHPEPEVRCLRTAEGGVPAYNVQTAIDAGHALILAHEVSTEANDQTRLQPMAEAVREALGPDPSSINILADAGYFNGKQVSACETAGMIPHIPAKRGVNSHGDGALLDRTAFAYQRETDTYLCPAGQTLRRKQLQRKDNAVIYEGQPAICGACAIRSTCTVSSKRSVSRHLNEDALERMRQRTTPQHMQLRRSIAEHPFAFLKYRVFGHPRFLLRGLRGARAEISLAVMAYNLRRMVNTLGGHNLTAKLQAVKS